MRLETRKLLEDVIQAGGAIQQFMAGRDLDAYIDDLLLRSAVERQFEIIGEAIRRLSRVEPTLAENIPHHRAIISFRNVLAHGYDIILDEVVWDVIQMHLPALLEYVHSVLRDE